MFQRFVEEQFAHVYKYGTQILSKPEAKSVEHDLALNFFDYFKKSDPGKLEDVRLSDSRS